jgi:hypothetical protein
MDVARRTVRFARRREGGLEIGSDGFDPAARAARIEGLARREVLGIAQPTGSECFVLTIG